MSEPDILYPAIFVFSMMLIGLLLTIREFTRLRKAEDERNTERRETRPRQQDSDIPVRRASGF